MKLLISSLFVALLACSSFAAPPTDSSIKELLTITESEKILVNMQTEMASVMKASIQQAFSGRTPDKKEQAAINKAQERMLAIFNEELNWEKLEPVYLKIYRDTFTQEEVDGMIAMYKTPRRKSVD